MVSPIGVVLNVPLIPLTSLALWPRDSRWPGRGLGPAGRPSAWVAVGLPGVDRGGRRWGVARRWGHAFVPEPSWGWVLGFYALLGLATAAGVGPLAVAGPQGRGGADAGLGRGGARPGRRTGGHGPPRRPAQRRGPGRRPRPGGRDRDRGGSAAALRLRPDARPVASAAGSSPPRSGRGACRRLDAVILRTPTPITTTACPTCSTASEFPTCWCHRGSQRAESRGDRTPHAGESPGRRRPDRHRGRGLVGRRVEVRCPAPGYKVGHIRHRQHAERGPRRVLAWPPANRGPRPHRPRRDIQASRSVPDRRFCLLRTPKAPIISPQTVAVER